MGNWWKRKDRSHQALTVLVLWTSWVMWFCGMNVSWARIIFRNTSSFYPVDASTTLLQSEHPPKSPDTNKWHLWPQHSQFAVLPWITCIREDSQDNGWLGFYLKKTFMPSSMHCHCWKLYWKLNFKRWPSDELEKAHPRNFSVKGQCDGLQAL